MRSLVFFVFCMSLVLSAGNVFAAVFTRTSQADRDGYVSNSGSVFESENAIKIGDQGAGGVFGFVSFSILDIPAQATVNSAILRLYQYNFSGDPYNKLGNLKIEHLVYGASLDSSDYSLEALNATVGVISTNSTVGWKNLDVTDQVQEDLANARARSQFRVRFVDAQFTGEGNNWIYVSAAEGGNPAQLVIDFNYALLTVAVDGNGSGSVTSSNGDIKCGSDCTELYQTSSNTTMVLTATPSDNDEFAGWTVVGETNSSTSSNSSNHSIIIHFDSDANVTATFYYVEGIPTLQDLGLAVMLAVLAGAMVWTVRRHGAV